MKLAATVLAAGLALIGPSAHAAVTFEFIMDGAAPLSTSSDGSVLTGTLAAGGYPAFRWTQATGPVHLGRIMHLGGGGQPAISADGTRIAYGIASLDSSYTTQGLWTLGSGWQELMPPVPPGGGTVDGTYGNSYGLSGDGNTVVGLYWRPGVGNRAHASKWTQATGVVDLGGMASGQSGRANGVNFDGSVITGWVETPTGPWRPAAWVNGSLVLLTNYSDATLAGSGEGRAVSSTGDFIVGFSRDSASNITAAALWKRTAGVFGPTQILGWIEGTTPGYGKNISYGVSNDGKIVVGYCTFDGDPFFTTGFIWTEATGILDINEFLANNGVLVDPNFQIQSLTAITPDGTQIFGVGKTLTPPYTTRGFRIRMPGTVGVPPDAAIADIELSAPRPNPSATASRLEFALSTTSNVDLSLFDASGRRVATLMRGELAAGRHSVAWDGREESGSRVGPGLYFARLSTARGTVTRRIVRL
jgi:uncharacterized membrane protein